MLWTPGDGTYTYTTHNRSALRLSRSVRCASKSRLTTLAHGLCASRCGRRWEAMGGDAEATTGAVEEAHGRLVRRARLNVGCVGLGVWLKGTSRAQVAGCGRGHEPRRKRRRRTRGAGDAVLGAMYAHQSGPGRRWQSSSGSSPRRRGRLACAREGRWSKGKRAAAAWGTGAKVRGCRAAGGSNTAVAAGAAAVGGCGGAAARPSAARPRSRARTSAPHHLARVRVKGEGEGEGGWASGLGSGLALGLARHMSLDWQAQPERGAGSNPKS